MSLKDSYVISQIIVRECDSCDYKLSFKTMTPVPIDSVCILPNSSCPKCKKGKLKLVMADVKTIPTKFGDRIRGYWYCTQHSNRKYYPNPLELSEKNQYPMNADGSYPKIVKMGFPWKCPTCKKVLRYGVEEGRLST